MDEGEDYWGQKDDFPEVLKWYRRGNSFLPLVPVDTASRPAKVCHSVHLLRVQAHWHQNEGYRKPGGKARTSFSSCVILKLARIPGSHH